MRTSEFPAPLIILGSPRSFTSVVCAMLGQHPEAYGMPELNLFMAPTLREMVESLGGYRQIQLHGLLRTVAQLYGGEQNLDTIEMARRWMLVRLEHSTGEIYRELCQKVGDRHVVDKSPIYAHKPEYLERIEAALPNARYLHLTRHPRTQGESIMKIAGGVMAILTDSIDYDTHPPVVDPQVGWLDTQLNIMNFLAHIPAERQMHLRGEDLLNDADNQFKLVCKWAGLSTRKAAIAAMHHPERSPYASLGPIGAHLGNDINFLRSPHYKPGRIAPSSLAGPLSWRPDQAGFFPDVVEVARALGYQ